jgi:hypothetical protein
MMKSIIRVAVVAAAVAAALIGCVDVSDVNGKKVDEFLGLLNGTKDTAKTKAVLDSITAAYDQKGAAVYPATPINALKANLTVTAWYDDGTKKVLAVNDYQLSGTLNIGISAVNVIYNGKYAPFNVTVSEPNNPPPPDAALTGITAVYDSSTAVYFGTTLDDLKKNLTVAAVYDNGETRVLDGSEYELSGTLSVNSSNITVIYGYYSATFNVRISVRDAAAKLYAKAPPISASDSPIDLSLSSGTVLDKAFNYVNANPGTYTFVLESDIDVVGGISYTAKLTQPETKLTIIGAGTERKISMVSGGLMSIELEAAQAKKAPEMELTLGDNVTFTGGVTVWTGTLNMRGNAKIANGSGVTSGVIVRDSGSFIMRDRAAVHGNSGVVFAGGVSVLYGGTFIMEGDASVYGNVCGNSSSTDATFANGVYVGAAGSFTMRDNASVHSNGGNAGGNNVGGVHVEGIGVAAILGNNSQTTFAMQGNASVYGNIGCGVSAKNGGEVVMKGDASVHDNKGGGARLGGGSLTMIDRASIYKNTTDGIGGSGGGVYVSSSRSGSFTYTGSFNMSGDASIYGNTAGGEYYSITVDGSGGGVYVAGSDFTMSGNASIYGNKAVGASGKGGGVYVGYNGSFTMEGGKIYGLDASDASKKNTVGQSGAALFMDSAKSVKYGDGSAITAGNGVDLTITGK